MAGFVQKFKDMWNPPEDEYDYDYEDQQQDDLLADHEDMVQEAPAREVAKRAPANPSNKVVNIHATAQLQVVLFKPERFGEETRAVADELLKICLLYTSSPIKNSLGQKRFLQPIIMSLQSWRSFWKA